MNVIKRSGRTEKLDIGKIRKATVDSIEGLNLSLSDLELDAKLTFRDGMHTEDIQQSVIKSAVDKIDVDEPNWTYCASRLFLYDLYHKVTGFSGYDHMRAYVKRGEASGRLILGLADMYDIDDLNAYIKPERDLQFTYMGIRTLNDRYLLKDKDNAPIELPQHMFMGVAMFLAQREVDKQTWAKKFYDILSKFEVMAATPTLSNARTPRHQLSSCYIGSTPDNIEGIFDAYKEMALLSKFGGGIGWDWSLVRGMGSFIDEHKNAAGGTIPFLKIANDICIGVDQLGTRKGAIAVYTEPWHLDIKDFLDLKKNSGEERRRAHDLFPALWINDIFMARVEEDANWTLFDPYQVEELSELHGEEFTKRYEELELDDSVHREVISAKGLWKEILRSYFETGSPFLTFKDSANRANSNRHNGIIRSTNLCFTGDTIVATADGRNGVSIKQLAKESKGKVKFPVYSGTKRKEHISKKLGMSSHRETIKYAVAFKTGKKKVITVKLSNGDEFRCTPDHVLFTIDGKEVEAKDTKGMELESTFTFTSKNGTPYRHIGSVTNGHSKQHLKIADFYNIKSNVKGMNIDHIKHETEFKNTIGFDSIGNLRSLTREDNLTITNKDRIGLKNTIHRLKDAVAYAFNTSISMTGKKNHKYSGIDNNELIDMFKAWCNEYDIDRPSKADYLSFAKSMRSRGHMVPLSFSNFRFEGSFKTFFRIIMGEDFHNEVVDNRKPIKNNEDKSRLEYIEKHFRNRKNGKIVAKGLIVTDIIDNGETEDVYDLTVDDNHNFYILTSTEDDGYLNAQGVLVHNCTEIFQNTSPNTYKIRFTFTNGDVESYDEKEMLTTDLGVTKPAKKVTALDMLNGRQVWMVDKERSDGDTAVCNLASVNLSKINTKEDMERVVPVAARMLDNVIDLNFYPLAKVKKTNESTRAIGLGVMGEAEMLANKKIHWGTPEHYKLIDSVMESFSYEMINASSDIAAEKGVYPLFEGSDWSKGIVPIDKANVKALELTDRDLDYDWDLLRNKISTQGMRNGYLMAIAPTSSISILTGTSQAIEPIYKRKWFEENLSGLIPVTAPRINPENWEYYTTAYELDQNILIKAGAIRQKWLDQGQSLNIFITLDKASGKYLNDIYMNAWKYGLKSTYYLRSESPEANNDVEDRSMECTGCQ